MAEENKKVEETVKQQEAEGTLPVSPLSVKEVVETVKKAKPQPEEEDENILVQGVTSDFWKVLKKRILIYADNVDDMLLSKIQGQANIDLQDVGLRYIVNSQVTNALKEIVNLVENTAKIHSEVIEDEQAEKAEEQQEESQGQEDN